MSMELNKESADQAGGDERAGFEAWLAQVMSRHFDPEFDLAKYEDSGEYRYNPAADYWKAWQARAALAQPSPKCVKCGGTGEADSGGVHPWGEPVLIPCDCETEQEEAERPEVVASVVHSNPVVLGQCGPLNANDELMTVAQHAASVARWAEMFNRVEQQRDAALARVEQQERTIAGMNEAHAKLAGLYEAAQAQHSVPDGAADLCRFLAKLYCELDGLRYSTAKLPAEQIADALIFKWPVLQGARNQLNIKRISEQPYDESKLHSAIAAMLAAAPGKEGV
ncbi:hypothetical protein [Pseudomonas aeruginosa]